MLATRAEHRPEEAWTSDSAGDKAAGSSGNRTTRAKSGARRVPHASLNARPRPSWLLDRPRALVTRDGEPLHHGPLTMVAGPERIQSGWWDNKPVDRDYFVARNPLGETCWVYRELDQSRRWYLHGVFG